MRKFLARIDDFFSRQKRKTLFVLVLLIVVLLGILDFLSGYELSFSFFYLFPIALAVWYLGRAEGRIAALLCSIIRAASSYLAGENFTLEFYRYWNAGIRFAIFLLFAELLFELKTALLQEQTLSRTDFLTGISNRREFYNRAELEILQARRYRHPLTVAVLDIDEFKQVNDTAGHHRGDALLRLIAQTIAASIRKTDLVARMGGDEFALLFPNTDQDGARRVIEKAKHILADRLNKEEFHVTFSLGAVTFSSPPASVDEMLRSADRLMYHVKAEGKDESTFR